MNQSKDLPWFFCSFFNQTCWFFDFILFSNFGNWSYFNLKMFKFWELGDSLILQNPPKPETSGGSLVLNCLWNTWNWSLWQNQRIVHSEALALYSSHHRSLGVIFSVFCIEVLCVLSHCLTAFVWFVWHEGLPPHWFVWSQKTHFMPWLQALFSVGLGFVKHFQKSFNVKVEEKKRRFVLQ